MDDKILRKRGVGFEELPEDMESPLIPGVYYPKKKHLRYRKTSSRKERVMFRNGEFNIKKPASKYRMGELFMNIVQARWRWTLFNFVAAYTANWLLFGCIYWFIAMCHGDFSDFSSNQNSTQVPCFRNIYGFTSAFLFSIEVHTTLAYGRRAITLECPQAILTMCLQCIFSSIFQTIMVGMLFAKLTRPKVRRQSIVFSKKAVVNLRDDKLCLILRIGDMRKDRILDIKASLFLIRFDSSDVADSYEQVEMTTEFDGCESTFFLWPLSVIHVIDEKSPFHKISAADLLCEKLEILAIFEGTIETTGQHVQARASFTEQDILWGHRFAPMVHSDVKRNILDVNFAKINKIEAVDTPLCSPWEYDDAVSSLKSTINGTEYESS